MKFLFKAKNDAGQIREGVIEAISQDLAAKILEKNGYTPITIAEDKTVDFFGKNFAKMLNGVSQKELMIFFRQLATLVEARVSIVLSLQTIGEQSENQYLRIIINEIGNDIKDGASFSDALGKHEDVFSSLTVSMIRAGEVSGNLRQSLEFVAQSIQKNYELTSKIKSALYYPAFVLSFAFIVGFLVVTFILPKITVMIKDLNVPIPWYTKVLINFGDFMSEYWIGTLFLIAALIGGIVYYLKTDEGKYEWQIIALKIPVVGGLLRNIYITRFAENLSALLVSGIPVVRSLIIVADVVGNHVYKEMILKAAEDVKVGGSMSTSFLQARDMPMIVAQMIRIGEESGTLPQVLNSVGTFYNQEVDTTTKNLTSLMEPVMIVLLGIGVGILVVGVLMPIYNVAGQL
ncbi:MAG: type II secretion system F family protein [Candidatus Moranbacteria bacterium]|nr:type II secretion system F family protein [Candidatus Moranbacteria bacterium]MDD3965396.1 type II secretion system F family protein [Candidatus Moranbacteria bacterium]